MRTSSASVPSLLDLLSTHVPTLSLLRNVDQDQDDALTPVGVCDEEDGGGARDRWPEWTGQNPQEGERMREWAGLGSGGVCVRTLPVAFQLRCLKAKR